VEEASPTIVSGRHGTGPARRVLALIAGVSLLSLLLASLPHPASAVVPQGAYLDSIVFFEQPSTSTALSQVSAGTEMQLYAYNLRTLAEKQAAASDPNVRSVRTTGNVIDLFVNPVPHGAGVSGFNPFQLQEVRHALNWLVDRDAIIEQVYGGYAVPFISPFHPVQPEYAREAGFFRSLDAANDYDPVAARQAAFVALSAVPDMSFGADGRWYYQGVPLTIRFVIRVEDSRRAVGDYIADRLEALGLTVVRDYRTAASAFSTVYFGPPDTGAWHLYTEGFAFTTLVAWQDDWIAGFYTAFSGETIWQLYSPPAALQTAADTLLNGQYTNYEERQSLIRDASRLAVEDGVRVWLAAEQAVFVHNAAVTGYVYDLMGGPWSTLAVRTARYTTEGGVLRVGTPVHFNSPWNPVRGFGWLYDLVQQRAFSDPGMGLHPHTGLQLPIRARPTVTTAGPSGGLEVPSDALVWDVAGASYVPVGPNVLAKTKVTFDFTLGTWQHGVPASLDDVWVLISHFFRRQTGDVVNPLSGIAFPAGDLGLMDRRAASDEVKAFLAAFKGARQIDVDTLEVYVDRWHIDPNAVAAFADVFPTVPWEVQEIMAKTVLDGESSYHSSTAANTGRVALDLTKGASLPLLAADLVSLRGATFVPSGFGGLITSAEATTRWAALEGFSRTATTVIDPGYVGGHFYVSNGPFFLSTVDVANRQTVMSRFGAYPLPADRWDDLLTPQIPTVAVDSVPETVPGDSVTTTARTELFGRPYDDVTLDFLVLDGATGSVRLSGKPTYEGPGLWRIALSSADTSSLEIGSYVLEVIAVGAEAAVVETATTPLSIVGNRAPALSSILVSKAATIPGEDVTFSATIHDPDGDTVNYRWDLGDGTIVDGPPGFEGGETSVTHAYGWVQTFEVRLTATDARGAESRSDAIAIVSEPGLLRVTTDPPVPGTIAVDGIARDEWGLNWAKIAPGSHRVSFGNVYGFGTPPLVVVVTGAGAVTEVAGRYEPWGILRVTTDPAVPAAIYVNGVPRNDWGVWMAVPSGTYFISFGQVAGYDPAAPRTVAIAPGQSVHVVGQYTANPIATGPDPATFGLLRVTTDPPVPATILVNGIPRDDWGLNWVKVAPGTYTISFSGVPGFTEPPDATVLVEAGRTTEHRGNFVVHGTLRVTTNPAVPATIFVNGVPRNDWGMWQSMEPGTYKVSFGSVPGYTTPPTRLVTVSSRAETHVIGEFLAQPLARAWDRQATAAAPMVAHEPAVFAELMQTDADPTQGPTRAASPASRSPAQTRLAASRRI